jgi:hypothetical protein
VRELKETGFGFIGNENTTSFSALLFPDKTVADPSVQPRGERFEWHVAGGVSLASTRELRRGQDASPSPKARGDWSMYLDGAWYGLTLGAEVTRPNRAVESLDVSILQDRLLDPDSGNQDVRTDKRIDFRRRYSRELRNWRKLVNEGKAAVAFSMFATTHRRSADGERRRRDHAAEINLVRAEAAGWIIESRDLGAPTSLSAVRRHPCLRFLKSPARMPVARTQGCVRSLKPALQILHSTATRRVRSAVADGHQSQSIRPLSIIDPARRCIQRASLCRIAFDNSPDQFRASTADREKIDSERASSSLKLSSFDDRRSVLSNQLGVFRRSRSFAQRNCLAIV